MTQQADKLVVRDLYKVFGSAPEKALALARDGLERAEILQRTGSVAAVSGISLTVRAREVFVVMGLSGSGKSTLVRCLNRLIEPTAGSIWLDGEDVVEADSDRLRQLRLEKVAMVFQHFALLPHKTVLENAAYGLKARGLKGEERRRRALEALEGVGLAEWADRLPEALSGGMQQRVGLARGLAVDPELLLMDEPFSALDPLIRREMQDELIELQRKLRTTIVFITHDLHEALKLGDRIAIMKDGRFVQAGTPEQIVAQPADDYVAAFTRDVDRSRVLTLGAVMRPALRLPPDTTLAEAGRRMDADGVGTALVTGVNDAAAGNGAAEQLLGFVTATDVAGQTADTPLSEVLRRDMSKAPAGRRLSETFSAFGGGMPLAVIEDDRIVGVVEPASVFGALQADTEA